jgi:hypothetical protein
VSDRLDEMAAARRRAQALARMRSLAQSGAGSRGGPGGGSRGGPGGGSVAGVPMAGAQERCDICGTSIPDDHRHLLHLEERRIVCSCEPCWALHSGDPEYRPSGMRTLWLDGFECGEELWGMLGLPIGLAFFMRSSVSDSVVAFYPSPAGATESELGLDAWAALAQANPVLEQLEPDAEALVVNRLAEPPQYAIAPIDVCYALVGLIKSRWEGISGGDALGGAVSEFFEAIRSRATGAPAAGVAR